ncbi:MAG: Y-family DNA polymerase [Bacteroidales bacterium]|nr:Y-family DNA polymerase [Bacteroidales bacterium]
MFALVDCNNFYASCERVFRPDLNGKPVVVLSNNDGCVISRSTEAKAIGIPMGIPAYQVEDLFKQHQVHIFSANFPLYGDMSNRVMDILGNFTPNMEIYSIDEAFLRLEGLNSEDLKRQVTVIYKKVYKWTNIPTSIGVAPTKALSKVAAHIAKKFPKKTNYIYIIQTEEQRIKALKWIKIEEVWGIGLRFAKRLKAEGINTGYDFTQMSRHWVRKHMSVTGLRLQQDLQGIPTLDLESVQAKKNIATTRTFEKNYTNYDDVKERVTTFAVACAEKLRKQHSTCSSITVFISTNRERKDLPQYRRSFYIQLPFATHSNIEVAHFAVLALEKIFKPGYYYKRAGVIVHELAPDDSCQKSLFENRDEKQIPLMQAIDKLNATYGQQKVRLGSQDLDRIWKMKQERLSPGYTTKISDIITVHCRE